MSSTPENIKEDIKASADVAEAVKSATDVAADSVTMAADAASKPAVVDQVIAGVEKAGKAYEKIGSGTAGNIMDKLFGGVASLFTGLKKINKDIEEGGGPKILP